MQALRSRIVLFFTIIIFSLPIVVPGQVKSNLVSGPWAGNVELRNATIWLEVSPKVRSVAVKYFLPGKSINAQTVEYKGELGNEFNPVKIELNGLAFNTNYNYTLILDGKSINANKDWQFTTKDLWQYRKPPPDFTFLAGSCAYFNEPAVDRPGTPYGADSSIFETMANTPAAFHLWLGDSWYNREVDYFTNWGLNYRASHDRSMGILQKFMASMPHYAIWDDHDYGPNDIGKSYELKEFSRKVFMNYWCNPSYGENGEGIYSKISHSDVDIFLTDNRYFRSPYELADTIDGKPNNDKAFFGKKQMDWLKDALLFSNATFKIIATGGQVLNPLNDFDCFNQYRGEYHELMSFLERQKIKGVIFLTGDRHHSEIIKMERKGTYTLYDITASPYTAGISKVRGKELQNPARINGTLVEKHNFAKINVTGSKGQRKMQVEFIGIKGEMLSLWSVAEKDLQ
ncbi:MAG: alkaline phosphatase D family protein [Chitinophagaceae bacterium]